MYEQERAAYETLVNDAPDTMTLRGVSIKYRMTEQSGGVYSDAVSTQGAALNKTPYIVAAGAVDWREGDIFTRRGKSYQIGAVSAVDERDATIGTQAQVTEVAA